MRRARYQYTYKRKRALHKAQLISARKRKGMSTKKKLAIAGGVGVIAVGVGATLYGRAIVRGGPENVTKTVPPQAKMSNKITHTPRVDAPAWHIGDKFHPEVGDAVEVSLKNIVRGNGFTRMYGTVVAQKWGRHTMTYKVDVRNPITGARFDEFIPDYGITGVKVGGAANLSASVQALQDERKKHRY